MAYPYYSGQQQPGVQTMPTQVVYGYPQAPQGQLEQLRAAQAYQAQAIPQATVQVPQNAAGTGIQWVQGEAGAKAYLVAPGASVLLMDSEGQSFYIKAADGTGMPMPLRIFDYTERSTQQQATPPAVQNAAQPAPSAEYATRAEFATLLHRLEELERQSTPTSSATIAAEQAQEKSENGGTKNGKRGVSAAQ